MHFHNNCEHDVWLSTFLFITKSCGYFRNLKHTTKTIHYFGIQADGMDVMASNNTFDGDFISQIVIAMCSPLSSMAILSAIRVIVCPGTDSGRDSSVRSLCLKPFHGQINASLGLLPSCIVSI